MLRRDFLKKTAIAAAAATVASQTLKAAPAEAVAEAASQPFANGEVDDFEIVTDEVVDGVRNVYATTSAVVCSSAMEIKIRVEDNVILSYVCIKGCPGNSVGIGRLVKGMRVEDVIGRLSGTLCAKRGTSCPDQLARILAALPALD